MRISHFVPLGGSRISMVGDILSELGIQNDCHLYAVRLYGEIYPTVIMSIIPPEIWDRSFKLTIYLAQKPGSFSEATEIISDMDINIVASWTAATTATGEGCCTAIVELPEHLMGSNMDNLLNEVTKNLEAKELLSESDLFKENLKKVTMAPLQVLSGLRKQVALVCQHAGVVENYSLDLKKFNDERGFNLFDSIFREGFIEKKIPLPRYCIVTPDTEERYIRVTFLPSNTRMIQISMRVEISSEQGIFRGYFGTVLGTLKNLGFNIYASDNFLLSKTGYMSTSKETTEIAVFVFAADAEKVKFPGNIQKWKNVLYKKVLTDLQLHAKNSSGKVGLLQEKFDVRDIDTLFTRCFFATNARKEEEGISYAQETIKTIRSLKLNPINVDIAKSIFVFDDVTKLIKASPILVSLHLPVGENKFFQSSDTNELFCPSDWVLFEETFALALERRVFRLRHEKVRQPRYSLGQREYIFHNMESFKTALRQLETAVKRHQADETYLKALRLSDEESRGFPPDLFRRDLDDAYF